MKRFPLKLTILIYIALTLKLYALGVLFNASWNIVEWPEESRVAIGLFWALTAVLSVGLSASFSYTETR